MERNGRYFPLSKEQKEVSDNKKSLVQLRGGERERERGDRNGWKAGAFRDSPSIYHVYQK